MNFIDITVNVLGCFLSVWLRWDLPRHSRGGFAGPVRKEALCSVMYIHIVNSCKIFYNIDEEGTVGMTL